MMHSSSYLRPKKNVMMKDSLNSGYRSRVERQIDDGNQVKLHIFRNWLGDCNRQNHSTKIWANQ